jgi:GT2 family glycosyltransferase
MADCKITVVIPTYQRPGQLLDAVMRIKICDPCPDEIIVHVDGNDNVSETVMAEMTDVRILRSPQQVGPGGGRNKAIALAKNEIIASFDDDSYPVDQDYFARLLRLFEAFPHAAVIGARIYHRDEAIALDGLATRWVHSFVGCGCAYRKSVFQRTQGYVPLPVAYGMEEVDLSLRLHDLGWGVLESDWLRVFHDTQLLHHSHPRITAASIANQMLLTYLRYPVLFFGLGILQCLSRVTWLLRHRRFAGILAGLWAMPGLILRYRNDRQTVSAQSLLSYQKLRRQSVRVDFVEQTSVAQKSQTTLFLSDDRRD